MRLHAGSDLITPLIRRGSATAAVLCEMAREVPATNPIFVSRVLGITSDTERRTKAESLTGAHKQWSPQRGQAIGGFRVRQRAAGSRVIPSVPKLSFADLCLAFGDMLTSIVLMNCRNARVITLQWLCHLLLACAVLIIQLPACAQSSAQSTPAQATSSLPHRSGLFPRQLRQDEVTISTKGAQEKDGNVYKLHQDVQIDFRDFTLRADEITYNQDTGDAVATGHVTLDGGANDEHIEATRAEYNIRTQNGKFENVLGRTGAGFGRKVALTTEEPFTFTGKQVEKIGPQHYVVHPVRVTSCALPKPKWTLNAERIDVDLSNEREDLQHDIPSGRRACSLPAIRYAPHNELWSPHRLPCAHVRRLIAQRNHHRRLSLFRHQSQHGRDHRRRSSSLLADGRSMATFAPSPASTLTLILITSAWSIAGSARRASIRAVRTSSSTPIAWLPQRIRGCSRYQLSKLIRLPAGLHGKLHAGGELRGKVAGVPVKEPRWILPQRLRGALSKLPECDSW